jgi:imidazolonepropionase-like amidohydrolase
MTPMQAIQSATIRAAELMKGRQGWIAGSGETADIIAAEGDALADLHRMMKVGFVMKGGSVEKAERQGDRRMRMPRMVSSAGCCWSR